MEIKEQNQSQIFDFYSKIKEIISQYESDLDKIDSEEVTIGKNANSQQKIDNIISITLKKIIFSIACELSSIFMDNVFLISKLKFQNFSDNKSFAKVLEDILYQIAKQLNIFIVRAIINIFETLRLGNFDNNSMVFFIKILLTFYFVHTHILLDLENGIGVNEDYDINFKKNYEKGFNDMKEFIKVIPLVELIINEDENLIYTILRIEDINDKIKEKERPLSTKSGTSTGGLPPVKTNKIKGLNINDKINIPTPFKEEENKLNNSLTDNFFKTQIK
jgi:hypothetical protein